jgi:hypothetical protein
MMAAWNYVIQLVAGDTIELYWGSADINMSIKAETSQTTPLVHPAVQSTIFTITQQAGILAGTGITAINSLTGATQTMVTGTDSSDFKIVSTGTSHTFNLPTASATKRGALSSTDWTTFNNKVNISDTATMLSKYLRKVDTVTLSNRIDLKSNLSQSSYTFLANNTNATANMSTQTFNDKGSQTYSGTITWNQTGAPSGTTSHSYRWTQVGKLVTLNIVLIYGSASTVSQTTVQMSLPTDLPNPAIPSGMTATNLDVLYMGTGNHYNTINTIPTTSGYVALRGTAAGGYEVVVTRAASTASVKYVNATIQYFTN